MPLQRSDTADKIIVDRRKRHRNSDVARAVRKTRDRLSQQPGGIAFERELLKLHARSIVAHSATLPFIVVLFAAGALWLGADAGILVWALITVSGYIGLAIVARRVETAEAAEISPSVVRRTMLVGHF